MKKQKIAIQGFEGSFHHQTAHHYFGEDIDLFCCDSFHKVVSGLQNEAGVDAAVMAIENSIAGSILPNYSLLEKADLQITGEVYLPIRQHLLANPGIAIDDIREVHTHPMAILQCADYLYASGWKLVETEDTALSARHLSQYHSRHIAAVAGAMAAQLFGLQILVPDIHTMKTNYTRFLILHRRATAVLPMGHNKASLLFHTDNSRGSLAKVLVQIAGEGINLSKLQSMPIPGSRFMYAFHADLEYDHPQQITRILEKLPAITESCRLLGQYRNGYIEAIAPGLLLAQEPTSSYQEVFIEEEPLAIEIPPSFSAQKPWQIEGKSATTAAINTKVSKNPSSENL